jgi:hypothetical protein
MEDVLSPVFDARSVSELVWGVPTVESTICRPFCSTGVALPEIEPASVMFEPLRLALASR